MTWTPAEIEAADLEAASWDGTPHMQRRRKKGRGVDCINLVWAVLEAGGQIPASGPPQYSQHLGAIGRNPLPDIIARFISVESIDEPAWEPRTGDIVVWKPIARTNHCGIVAGGSVWHASVTQGVHRKTIEIARRRCQEVLRLTAKGFLVEDPATIRIR